MEVEGAEAKSERLHHGLAGGKSGCKRRDRIGLWFDIVEFALRENSCSHRWRPFKRGTESLDVNDVDTDPNHRTVTLSSSMSQLFQ
jgi:hypothetical protein